MPTPANDGSFSDPEQPTHVAGRLLAEARELLAQDLEAARHRLDRAAALLQGAGQGDSHGSFAFHRGGLTPVQGQRVSDHVAANLSGRLATPQLAALAGLSVSYFSAAFRVTFGCSPQTYVLQQRVRAAQAWMVQTPLPLTQIALACGFSDQPHFCRHFRRATGLTPAAWRRRNAAVPLCGAARRASQLDRRFVQHAGGSDNSAVVEGDMLPLDAPA